jgi:RimJ/RimL family protein N-acetyltransferase
MALNTLNIFNPSQNVLLENEHVLLRPLEASDVEHLIEFSMNEPDIWTFSLVKPIGKTNLEKYVQTTLEARAAKTEFPFIVFDKRTQKYAGSTRFYDIQLPYKTLQLGYTWYGKQFQGTGLNKHCKFLLLQFAFEKMDMLRVEFRADNKNVRSIAAMKSIGCTAEGVLRSNVPNADGGRRDSIVLSVLKDEWHSHVKENLQKKL